MRARVLALGVPLELGIYTKTLQRADGLVFYSCRMGTV